MKIMKVRLPSSKLIGLSLIFIMFLSTFAFSVLQSTIFTPSQNVNMPESRIVNYRLSPQQEELIIRSGGTIITFIYNPSCNECLDQKNYLENLAMRYTWLFLETISTETNYTRIYIQTPLGQRSLENKTNKQIFDVICELAYQPPVECVLS